MADAPRASLQSALWRCGTPGALFAVTMVTQGRARDAGPGRVKSRREGMVEMGVYIGPARLVQCT
jgi:hypothetical protein